MPDIITALLIGAVFGFLGRAFLDQKPTSESSVSAPAKTLAETYQEQITLLNSQNMMREIQLNQQRMETEMLELQQRRNLVMEGKYKTASQHIRDDVRFFLSDLASRDGYDVSPTGNFKGV